MTAAPDLRALQRKVFLACRELGIDADTRHDLQRVVTGKESIAGMDARDLRALLDALEKRGFKPGFKPGVKGRRPAAARPDLRFIHVLWRRLGEAGALRRPGPDGLNAFIRARFEAKWGAVPLDIDTMCDAGQINDVIRALKDMCARAGVAVP